MQNSSCVYPTVTHHTEGARHKKKLASRNSEKKSYCFSGVVAFCFQVKVHYYAASHPDLFRNQNKTHFMACTSNDVALDNIAELILKTLTSSRRCIGQQHIWQSVRSYLLRWRSRRMVHETLTSFRGTFLDSKQFNRVPFTAVTLGASDYTLHNLYIFVSLSLHKYSNFLNSFLALNLCIFKNTKKYIINWI